MSESKKDSNELLNILMIIIGALFAFLGIINLLATFGINITGITIPAVPEILGSSGLVSAVLGFWCLVSGIGMFKEQEWAMGQGLVVLSVIAVQTLSIMLTWFTIGFDAGAWTNYVVIVAFVLGLVGFFWLLVTRRRYD